MAAVFCYNRGVARDRPSPYGNRHVVFHRSAGPVPRELPNETEKPSFFVARGPVPRDLSNETENVRQTGMGGRFLLQSWHGEGQALALR